MATMRTSVLSSARSYRFGRGRAMADCSARAPVPGRGPVAPAPSGLRRRDSLAGDFVASLVPAGSGQTVSIGGDCRSPVIGQSAVRAATDATNLRSCGTSARRSPTESASRTRPADSPDRPTSRKYGRKRPAARHLAVGESVILASIGLPLGGCWRGFPDSEYVGHGHPRLESRRHLRSGSVQGSNGARHGIPGIEAEVVA